MVAAVVRVAPFLFALAADPLVRIEGSSTCPRPEQVSGHLARFLPARPADVSADRARVDAVAEGVRVELRRGADAGIVAEKTLAHGASCAELAEAIGLILAMWEWPLHPGLAPPIDDAALVPSARVPAATAATTSAGPPARRDRFRVETGAGARAVLPGPVPGVALDAVLRGRASGWGGRLVLSGSWWNELDLAGGQASWTRAYAGLGLVKGWEGERWFLDAHADVLGAALFATGRGYDEARAPVAFDPGIGLGLRAGLATGRLARLWVEATLAWWPLRPELGVDGVGQRVEVAALEPALALGGTFLIGR